MGVASSANACIQYCDISTDRGYWKMNSIDTGFYALANEIETLQEQEIYHRIRTAFERVPAQTRKNCADFFNRFGFWGRLEPEKGIYEQIAGKAKTLYDHMLSLIHI